MFGPDTVRVDSAAEFRTVTTDPEADLITYAFAWGDGDSVTAPGYASGDTARMLHAWSGTGEYQVRTTASDVAGHKSPWSPPHAVVVVP
ncbi:MAG: PKD domain-containing protein [candidate division WOR-3 bacterium]|nr:PKD domain-containing protein [candidate division WOR-3 bacterium]